ncbi:hypothetical protein M3Y98_00765800 [Aphelenchoides besseyi]|nr:hypothetical protein M3Y98_00765800 [Aphelenchoides besseyi]KAI6211689.1 hypothetical protein M3Y96_00460700 [Aphelenchoides besseyi]
MAEELQKAVNDEASKVFKNLAVDAITMNDERFDLGYTYQFQIDEMDPLNILNELRLESAAPTFLQPVISSETGEILDYEERWNQPETDTSLSMSLTRPPDPLAFLSVVGRRGNLPFLPGGFDEVDAILKETQYEEIDFSELITQPPNYPKSLDLPETVEKIGNSVVNSLDLPPGVELPMEELLTQKSVPEKKVDKAVIKEDEKVVEQEEQEVEDAPEDMTADTRDNDKDYTHAKFLSDSKVQKRYEQIRPIMAKTFSFELDSFQKQAVVSMENGDSVFVAAHTSAGKTVVAEYAIALCHIHKTRVIYTSPIKALSNQKFREFKQEFQDVGLITGDIQLHTDAFCLIMTTEVLRSMLYNGSEVIRELEWVIFDEVHYINDEERGHVWEEVLIMLPAHVSIVMLSATVPNCVEFADWVGRIKQRKITVIQTFKRPVPLEHFIYTGHNGKSRDELFMIMDKNGQLLTRGYQNALTAKQKLVRIPDPRFQQQPSGGNQQQRNLRGGGNRFQHQQMQQAVRVHQSIAANQPKRSNYAVDRSVYSNLTAFLQQKDFMPCVIFVFSRKRCDDNANMMQSADLTTAKEKSEITRFFNKCIDRLKGSDKILPQVIRMKSYCEHGFAVHHSGILPILKEVVELLFQRGLVKVLFATETFAMGWSKEMCCGVNMPARTVVFDAIEKFDGNQKRDLNPTEYTQMAGRAGRRGLDATGIVIILAKRELPPITTYSQLLTGKAVRLESRFRVTYAMLLKLLRVEQFRIEDMLQRSYVERSSLRLVTTRKNRISELKDEIRALPAANCEYCFAQRPDSDRPSIEEYMSDLRAYLTDVSYLWPSLVEAHGLQKTLSKGRILLINYPPLNLTGRLGVILDMKRDEHGRNQLVLFIAADESKREEENAELKAWSALNDEERLLRINSTILRHVARNGLFHIDAPRQRSYRVIPDFDLRFIVGICKQSVKNVDADSILKEDSKRNNQRARSPDRCISRVLVELDSLAERWSISGAPISQFDVDIKAKDVHVYERLKFLKTLQDKLTDKANYPCRQCALFENHFVDLMQRADLTDKLQTLTFQTSSNALLLSEEYQNRIYVLRALDYVDKNNIIGLKGKVACEISHLEVLITELILENQMEGKTCAELAAMLSPLTCQFTYAGSRDRDLNMEFKHPINDVLRHNIVTVAQRIDAMQVTCGVHTPLIMDELRFGLMDVVYEWASGTPFHDIMLLTDCQEGLIVRCIQRLDEVCKDVRNAARIIGDPNLYEKFEETSTLIKRDIVFAASLYTTDE